jgi:predicted  nucleic acid-binding Zn-ribbon protein
MVKQVDDLQAGVSGLNSSISSMKSDSDFQQQEDQLRRRLSQATTGLANCGKSASEKSKYKKMIDEANQQLGECSRTWRDNNTSKEEKTRKLKELNANFQAQLNQLRRREGIM